MPRAHEGTRRRHSGTQTRLYADGGPRVNRRCEGRGNPRRAGPQTCLGPKCRAAGELERTVSRCRDNRVYMAGVRGLMANPLWQRRVWSGCLIKGGLRDTPDIDVSKNKLAVVGLAVNGGITPPPTTYIPPPKSTPKPTGGCGPHGWPGQAAVQSKESRNPRRLRGLWCR